MFTFKEEEKYKHRRARTIIEISGACIKTIPVGTEFIITNHNKDGQYYMCSGIGITSIWPEEFEFI